MMFKPVETVIGYNSDYPFSFGEGKELSSRTEKVCEQDCNPAMCMCAFTNKLAIQLWEQLSKLSNPSMLIWTALLDTVIRLMQLCNAT